MEVRLNYEYPRKNLMHAITGRHQVPLPERIHKYRPPNEHAFRNLESSVLWVAHPSTFNDPFDISLRTIDRRIQESIEAVSTDQSVAIMSGFVTEPDPRIRRNIQRYIRSRGDEAPRIFKTMLRKSVQVAVSACQGICCFTHKPLCPMMWAHYAENHKGFCIEFDTSFIPFTHPELTEQLLFPVKYMDKLPLLNLEQIQSGDRNFIIDYVTTKSTEWGHEKEWRLLYGRANFPLSYDPCCITKVLIGKDMTIDHAQRICQIFAGTKTEVHRVSLDQHNGTLTSRIIRT